MRKIFSTMVLMMVLVLAVSAGCFAEAAEEMDASAWLEPSLGDWYSNNGELALSVQSDALNGCAITGASDLTASYPRTGTFEVAEPEKSRTMTLEVFGNDIHQYLIVDGTTALRRSQAPEYFESMGGIYLGMSETDLLHYYGKPANTVEENGQVRWEYDTDKFAVILKGHMVTGVRIYQGSTRHFDRSGLGSKDTPASYAQTYGMNDVPEIPAGDAAASAHMSIGQGEYMFFTPSYVQLTVYNY